MLDHENKYTPEPTYRPTPLPVCNLWDTIQTESFLLQGSIGTGDELHDRERLDFFCAARDAILAFLTAPLPYRICAGCENPGGRVRAYGVEYAATGELGHALWCDDCAALVGDDYAPQIGRHWLEEA